MTQNLRDLLAYLDEASREALRASATVPFSKALELRAEAEELSQLRENVFTRYADKTTEDFQMELDLKAA